MSNNKTEIVHVESDKDNCPADALMNHFRKKSKY